jgi:hypothetical protein
MELGAEGLCQACTPKVLVPGDAFEEGIDQAHQHRRGDQLRIELGALGDAAGDDGRDGGGKGQQEEELDQLEAALLASVSAPAKKLTP